MRKKSAALKIGPGGGSTTDNFERVLILLFEEDIVTGQWEEKVLNFLNLDPLPEGLGNLHKNKSGYPQNRLLHQVTTRILMDELIVRKIKDMFELTPFHAASKRIYRKILEANLKKEKMAAETREMLKEKFQTMSACWRSILDCRCGSSGRIFGRKSSRLENNFSDIRYLEYRGPRISVCETTSSSQPTALTF